MTQSHFSLSWDAHQKNICSGLSSLQQNGEFVDMTIAADGHMVKVHQVIIALASPYIKELIASANCPHPVVFLNNISYTTLCSILEYIYTGEAMVAIEDITKLAEAGQRLHIKGLEQMKFNHMTSSVDHTQKTYEVKVEQPQLREPDTDTLEEEICYFEIASPKDNDATQYQISDLTTAASLNKELEVFDETMDDEESGMIMAETEFTDANDKIQNKGDSISDIVLSEPVTSAVQYTVSTQGSLQMILNRFIYYLKHTNRRDGTRQWRCVDYLAPSRCPAYVVTHEDTAVLHREAAHTHFFHDKKIMKKVQAGAIFTAIQEAVDEGKSKKVHSTTKASEGAVSGTSTTYQAVS